MKKSFHVFALFLLVASCAINKVSAQSISGIVNAYSAVTAITQPACAPCDAACIHTITVANGALFAPGDKALIIQMKGATINTANAAGSGNVTAINNAGNYEFFEVGSIVGNVLTPRYPLIRSYTVSGKVQVVRIPQFADNVTITGTLMSQDWDEVSGTGGVVAIEAGKVTFNAGIDVLGQGYKGIQMLVNGTPDDCSIVPTNVFVVNSGTNSTYTKGDGIVLDNAATNRGRAPRANGGGSGISGDSGGGGGSNYGAGGEGGKRWCDIDGANAGGLGGYALTTFLAQNKVFLGGAGGPGFVTTNNPSNAADGGGIVIIFADTIVGNGNMINARGTAPVAINPVGSPDGGGGGGAGGSVVLKTQTYIGALSVDVRGGDGQDLNTTTPHGPGGGGGGGVLLYSLASIPANLTLTATGGQGGQHSAGASSLRNGSQDGSNGGSISLYVPIQNPNYQGNVDNDVIPVSCDIDDDNDGITDVVEAYSGDHDSDGIPDYADAGFCAAVFQGVNGWDCATNGLPDPSGDMDGDLIPNYQDADFPYCGGMLSSGVCANFDEDRDGNPVHLDLDSDNDGIPDLIEAGGVDTNGDGQIDATADSDGDGLVNQYDNNDTDGPVGSSPCSPSPNCLLNTSTSLLFDTDANGSNNYFADFDNDGIANFMDLDSDNDGITDVIESGGTDANGDGLADAFADIDNDGYNDVYDAVFVNCTTTGSYIYTPPTTAYATSHGPGNVSVTNPNNALGQPLAADFALMDSNGDIFTMQIATTIASGGTINVYISNPSGNQANTNIQFSTNGTTFTNTTATNIPAANTAMTTYSFVVPINTVAIRILRTDNDDINVHGLDYIIPASVSNTLSTTCVTANGTPMILTGNDTNSDGKPNSYVSGNADSDLQCNFIDIDSDNDGIVDNSEAQSTAGYIAPSGLDTDGDGIDNAYDGNNGGTSIVPVNTDGTDTRDYLDLNSDNDALTDLVEGWDTDGNGTANTVPLGTDSDNDGLDDAFDVNDALVNPTNGTTPSSYPNVNAPLTTERDWREIILAPTVTLSGTTTIAENAAGVATLTATLSNPVPTATTVTLTYSGTASAGDYVASSVTITIPAGATSGTVTIDPTDDLIFEGSETVIADITSVTGGNGATESGTQTATVTITDNETAPTVTLSGTTSIVENAAGVATLTATLSVATTAATTITLTYSGTASAGDYVASSVTITIPAGATSGTVTIDPTDDVIFEGSETVIADITSVTGGNGASESGTQTATVTITDNETAPTVTLSGTTTIAENAAGVVTLTATLSVATTAATTITLTYSGTASAGDYVASSVTITIPAGATSGTVTIDPTDDLIFEGSETVIADITSVTGGNGASESGTQTATVTITDNETAPTVTLSGTTTIAENAAGVATLTATLSVATTAATTVTLTYSGTASAGDYVASSVTITIPAGATSGTVTIDPTDDLIFEGSETVIADITSVTGGNGASESGTQTATVTITDDETAPTVTLSGTTTIAENAAGVATLTATLSVATTAATTVTLTYSGTASAGDYVASSVTITIPAGATSGTVTIDPTDDVIFEGSETVIADITSVTGGNGASESGTQTATVTITDNETAPTVTLSGTTTIAENAAGVATLTATLSVATTAATTVTLTYSGTASAGDYVASSVTITIPAGATSGTVTIDPTDDVIFEGSETVIADITSVTGGNGASESGTQTATVTITDNETAPTVTLSGTTTIAENAAGVATLTATLSVATTAATTVTLTYSGTASAGDYVASSVTITIPAGATSGTVTIDPTDDVIFEGSETVIADITSVTGGNGASESGTQTATVTITDNETAPTVTLSGTTTIAENAPGVATLTATLSVATTAVTTITLTYSGTASAGDYVASSVTITIPAGATSGTITIDPTDDLIFEGSETVIADITSVTGGNGASESGTQTATVTITDNETAPTVTLSGTTTIAENAAGVATLTATLSVATTAATTVTLTYSGTASAGDYAASSVTITIPAGATSGTVTIDPTDDVIFEGSETVIADITSVTGGNGASESGTQTATVTITDNETAPTVTLSGTTTIAENAAGVATLTATLSVATTTATTITITYTGTATSGVDYVASSVTITIPAGALTGTVTIDPSIDALFEGPETVIADITSVAGGNGASESGTQTAIVTILDANLPPVANDDNGGSLTEDGANGTVNVINNDTDPDGNPTAPVNGGGQFTIDLDPSTAGVQTSVTNATGTWTLNASTGVVTFDPANNYNGTATITYTLCDPASACDNATITFVVNPVNDAPVVDNETHTTPEETPVSGDLTNAGDSDIDGNLVVNTTPLSGPNNGGIVINSDGTYTYTPGSNFNGNDMVVVQICDDGTPLPAICVNDTIFITVTPVNDTPSKGNETLVVTEDAGLTTSGNLTTNNVDPDGTPITVTTIVSTTGGGTVTINGNGTVNYTPAPNFNGIDTVIYTACDNGLPLPAICVNDTLFVTVNPVNDTPSKGNETLTVNEDAGPTTSGNLTTNNVDPDGTPITVTTIVSTTGGGTVAINGNGTVNYTPAPNFNGIDTVIYTACDNGLPLPALCVNDTLFVTVNPINDTPSQGNETLVVDEDAGPTTSVILTTNNVDPDGTPITVTTIVSTTGGGTVIINGNGTVNYTPAPNFNGIDTVIYTACDNGLPLPAVCVNDTLFVTVNPINDAPSQGNETLTVNEDAGPTTSGNLTTNNVDPDGTPITVTTIVSTTGGGTVTINGNGTVNYTPAPNFNGIDTVIYTACDNGLPLPALCVNDTLFVTVNPINDTPSQGNETLVVTEDAGPTTSVILTTNNVDPDGTPITVTTIVSTTGGGTVTINGNGTVNYTPAPNFNGIDTVIYTACDNGLPLPAVCVNDTLFVTVNPINDTPSQGNETLTVNEDAGATTTIDLTTNNIDPDGTPITVTTIVSTTGGGTVTINGNGTVNYTPAPNFNGIDTVIYTACDNGLPLPALCVNDTLFVTVNPVNDPPIVDDELLTTSLDIPVSGDLTNAGDTDVDGNLVVNTIPVDGPSNGGIVINPNGTFTYTPNSGYFGGDTIVVQICDDGTPLPAICVNDTIFISVLPCSVANPVADCDGDGVTNGDEIDPDGDGTPGPNGTDPSNPCDLNMADQNFATVSASWLATDCDGDGVTNEEEVDPDGDGTPGPNGTDPTDPCDYNAADQNYASVNATWLAADCDGDGVTNEEEIDPDGDGTPGPNGTDPSDLCDYDVLAQNYATVSSLWLAADCDGDGVTNEDEVDPDGDGTPGPNGTDPFDPCDYNSAVQNYATVNASWLATDCDGDGVTNGDEVDPDGDGTPGPNGTDPSNPCDLNVADQNYATVDPTWLAGDCDGDGVTNEDEVDPDGDGTPGPNGTDPTNPCDYDVAVQNYASVNAAWLAADCDGDGVTNEDEVDPDGDGTPGPNGTNPSDPCDYDATVQNYASVNATWLAADCDGDGVTNEEEIDPDGDGTPGPNGTDPNDPCDYTVANQNYATVDATWLAADCDGDGVTNEDEVDPDGDGTPGPNGTDPSNPCDLNVADQNYATVDPAWLAGDCDGDGVTNEDEVDPDGDGTPGPNGTDPSNPCDYSETSQNIATVDATWNALDCDGDGTPNGTDGEPLNPCVDNGTLGDEDLSNPIYANADCDGDGVTNGDETDPDGDGTPGPNGTDPNNPCDFTTINQDLSTVSAGWLILDCDGDGVTNGDEVDPDGDGTPGPNGTNPTDPCDYTAADQNLASVNAAWNALDCDGDGTPNGTDTEPLNPCVDNGVVGDEVLTNPIFADADCDGDGVTNGDEVDPDGDGTPGPNGTNPNDPCDYLASAQNYASVDTAWLALDCDGDGVTNGGEVDPDGDGTPGPNGTNPSDPCDYNPAGQDVSSVDSTWNALDCDGDGLTNGEEVLNGSDPLNACSPKPCDEFDIPEAFSPDGDGVNETFIIKGIENFPGNNLIIFNRWGNEVFNVTEYDNSWAGTSTSNLNIGGDQLPTGTYYYIFDTKTEQYGVLKGYVYLKR